MQVWQIIMPIFCVTKMVVLSKKTTHSYNRGYTTHYTCACKYHDRVHTLLLKCMRDCRKSVYDTINALFFSCFMFFGSCKIGQFDTIMQNRTIWHCEKFSPTVLKKVVIGQQCISNDIFGPNSCQEIKYVFMCGPCRARIWYRLIIQDNFQSKR